MRASAAAASRVIHLVPPNGGGVDRFVRDLVAHRPADWIVHVCEAQAVVEVPARQRFVPLDAGAFAHLAWAGRLGRPLAVHAHSTTDVVRRVADVLCAAMDVPCVLTLHDIGFDDAAAGVAEHQARLRFAAAAAVRTAPSRYIVERTQAALGRDVTCHWLENGVDPLPSSTSPVAPAPIGPFAVAAIGALGEHKGVVALLETAALLPPEVRVVILGYTAFQLMPGWAVPERVWMHGAFQPDELPTLVRRYGARLAFFAPGMPESYCYALSDAWLAGLPALVPDHGALGERVRRHGGGSVYDPHLSPQALAKRICADIAGVAPHTATRAAAALCTRRTMATQMNKLYDEAGGHFSPQPADDDLLRDLAQKHLDTRFFRRELLWQQDKLIDLERERDALRLQLRENEQQAANRLSVLERDLERCHARFDDEFAEMVRQRDHALACHAALAARLRRPLRVLPAPLRERVVRLAKRLLP